ISGTSSTGPTLPFLFGRGSVMHAEDFSRYDPRRGGITLRGAAIAAAAPVAPAGPASPATLYPPTFKGLQGVTPFALNLTAWNNLPQGPYTVDASGAISDKNGGAVGQLIRISAVGAAGFSASDTTLTITSFRGFPQ